MPVELVELSRSPWRPGRFTKSGKPELTFDLEGRLPAVRRELRVLRALVLDAGLGEVHNVAISPDGATTIVAGGDLLFWLRDTQPPVLLDPGSS